MIVMQVTKKTLILRKMVVLMRRRDVRVMTMIKGVVVIALTR
jgi:hypothetical protein